MGVCVYFHGICQFWGNNNAFELVTLKSLLSPTPPFPIFTANYVRYYGQILMSLNA